MYKHALAAAVSAVALSSSAFAQTADPAARRAELLRARAAIDAELETLNTPATSAARPATSAAAPDAVADRGAEQGDIIVTGKALSLTTKVAGQTVTTIADQAFRNTPATTIAEYRPALAGRGSDPR